MTLQCCIVNISFIFLQFQWSGDALLVRPEHTPLLTAELEFLLSESQIFSGRLTQRYCVWLAFWKR
jgi:hypothetical protein